MDKTLHWLLLTILLASILITSGCSSQAIQIIKDDGGRVVVNADFICPGAKYQMIINQDPSKIRTVEPEATDNKTLQFKGSDLDIFDFSQPLTITVIIKDAGEKDCPAPFRALVGKAFEAKGVRPIAVPNESKTYAVKLSEFKPK